MRLTCVMLMIYMLFSSICLAAEHLPIILNSYPKCDYRLIEQVSASNSAIARAEMVEQSQQAVLADLIQRVRQRAYSLGAEAIILKKVQGEIGNSQSIRTIRHAGHEVQYHLTAEFIELCQEDTSLQTQVTPYNSAGLPQRQLQHQQVTSHIQLDISIPARPTNNSGAQQPLTSAISLQHGFYGAALGMTTLQVQSLFGLPDAELTLKNNAKAWIYGQQHQVIFADNAVMSFSQSNHLLSAELTNRLADNLRFQQHDWVIDNVFRRRAALDDIQAFYQHKLAALDTQRFALSDQHNQLIMNFAPFLDINTNRNHLQLLSVSMSRQDFSAIDMELKFPTPETQQWLRPLLANLDTPEIGEAAVIPEMMMLNHSTLRNGQRITVLSPSLAISYQGEQLTGLIVTNTTGSYDINEIQQQLVLLHLPSSKADFILRFPEAFDGLNQLTLYTTQHEIKATYDADKQIDSLFISWY